MIKLYNEERKRVWLRARERKEGEPLREVEPMESL